MGKSSVDYKELASKRREYIKKLGGEGVSDQLLREELDDTSYNENNFIKYMERCKLKLEEAVLYAEKAGEYSTYRKVTERCIEAPPEEEGAFPMMKFEEEESTS